MKQKRFKQFRYIHAYPRIFRHIHTSSGIIKHIQELFKQIQAYSEPFVTLTYLEPKYIWNQKYIQNLVYSEPCQTSTMERFAKVVNGYNYFRNITFLRSLLCEKSMYFLIHV